MLACLPQALSSSGRVREARFKLSEVIKYSKNNVNGDAEKLLKELDGKVCMPAVSHHPHPFPNSKGERRQSEGNPHFTSSPQSVLIPCQGDATSRLLPIHSLGSDLIHSSPRFSIAGRQPAG